MKDVRAGSSAPRALPDLLNYGVMLQHGIVLCKDGRLLAGVGFAGPDNASLSNDMLNSIGFQMNQKLMRFGHGWSLHVDAFRDKAAEYPAKDDLHFPDEISALIDNTRRQRFELGGGEYYETTYFAVLSYLPPKLAKSKLEQMMYSDGGKEVTIADKILGEFVEVFGGFCRDLSNVAAINIMRGYTLEKVSGEVQGDELVDYLHRCICGRRDRLNLCESAPFLDSILGRFDFVSGLEPMIDGKHIRVVAIDGYPQYTFPGVLWVLDSLPMEYRWSNRFIYMGNDEAKAELGSLRRGWLQKQRGFIDQIFGTSRSAIDRDAVGMVDETEQALASLSSGDVGFGYFTSVVVLQSDNLELITESAKELMAKVREFGCSARMETLNCVDAWLGSLPGHNHSNVRRPMIHTQNLAHLLPLSSMWAGSMHNPCPLYPPKSPALLYVDTTGSTIFRLNLHVSDVGHTMIFGPTGGGKSTLLCLLAAQFRKYAEAQVFSFDKGYSMYCLTEAVGGSHFDIGGDDVNLTLSPLQELDTLDDRVWAEGWLQACCELQLNRQTDPKEKNAIHTMVGSLSAEAPEYRTITGAMNQLQNETLREALKNYTLEGSIGHLLDGDKDGLKLSKFVCFELQTLMNFENSNSLPVLLYLFRRVEKALTGAPAIIIIDEAWLVLGHPIFRSKIVEWLKVMRKNNAAVVLATQSLSDAVKSEILDVLVESTATRIFLPNPSANSDSSRKAYEQIGLNHKEISMIAGARPKREYYVTSGGSTRMIDLALGPTELSFIGQSGEGSKKEIEKCKQEHRGNWRSAWLRECGVDPSNFNLTEQRVKS